MRQKRGLVVSVLATKCSSKFLMEQKVGVVKEENSPENSKKKCLSVVKKKILVNSCWAESVVSSLSACGPLFAARLWLLVRPSNPSPSWLRVAVSLIHSQAGRAVLQGSLALEEEGEIQKEAVFAPG